LFVRILNKDRNEAEPNEFTLKEIRVELRGAHIYGKNKHHWNS